VSEAVCFLYDFDGLLIDSETAGLISWQELYAEHGYELDLDHWLAEVVASRGPVMPTAAFENAHGSAPDWRRLEAERIRRRDELLVARPGVPGHLAAAAAAGVRLAIVSNAPDWWVDAMLEHTGIDPDLFEIVVTKSPELAKKPQPDAYLHAMRTLDTTADRVLVFEDSPPGIAAATAAGLLCVAVPNAVTERMDLSGAPVILPRIDALPVHRLIALARG
jgi:HAD superfamily hydrolase (TIGR01509 family)